MGWFLSKKKSGATKRKKKPAAADRPKWDPQRTLAAVKVAAAVGALAALAFTWHWSEGQLRQYVHARSAQAVSAEQVELIEAPGWMSVLLHEELRELVAAQISADPMDRAGLARAAYALSNNPWVQEVQQVWRLPGGVVAVAAEFREPVAVVEGRDGFYHMVDGHGVRLPGLYERHHLSKLPLPVIVGMSRAANPVGRVWPGEDMQAGLALVQLIGDEPYAHQIKAVDVSHRDSLGRIRLVMHTKHGVVRWGLPPQEEQAIEPSAAQKKQWLAGVYHQLGSIDAGGKMVDLYGAAVFVHPDGPGDGELQVRYTWTE